MEINVAKRDKYISKYLFYLIKPVLKLIYLTKLGMIKKVEGIHISIFPKL